MAAGVWQPQEEGLREICGLLEQQITPNSDQARIWQQLQHYSQFPDFINYLAFILARTEQKLSNISDAVWKDREAAVLAIGAVAEGCIGGLYPHLPEQKLSSISDAVWKDREAAVLAIGAVAEGCIGGLYPHLPEIIAFLIPLLDDKFSLIQASLAGLFLVTASSSYK